MEKKKYFSWENDPEFTERFLYFMEEVETEKGQQLDDATRCLAVTAALIGCQGIDLFRAFLPEALSCGLTPAMAKETVYQAVDYLGIGRVYPFLSAVDQVLESLNILPKQENRAVSTVENRLDLGAETQAAIFGDEMKEAWKRGHMNRFLAANCFGDYYTRRGLDLRQREMITFCFLAAQGGCEPQLTAHVRGNVNLGNDKAFLMRVVTQCLPYIGYPRSLNAITCIEKA